MRLKYFYILKSIVFFSSSSSFICVSVYVLCMGSKVHKQIVQLKSIHENNNRKFGVVFMIFELLLLRKITIKLRNYNIKVDTLQSIKFFEIPSFWFEKPMNP